MNALRGDELAQALRAWGRGYYPWEAGVYLLVATGMADRIAWDRSVLTLHDLGDEKRASIDWAALVEHANNGPYSGGERRLLVIAAALAGQACEFDVSNLDDNYLARVLEAVSHAAGRLATVELWPR